MSDDSGPNSPACCVKLELGVANELQMLLMCARDDVISLDDDPLMLY